MEIINIGTNEDGTPNVLYHAPGEHVVLTPNGVNGSVTLEDGTVVDVTGRCIVATSTEQAAEIVSLIDAGEVA